MKQGSDSFGVKMSPLQNQSNIFCSEKQRKVRQVRVPYDILFSYFHLKIGGKI